MNRFLASLFVGLLFLIASPAISFASSSTCESDADAGNALCTCDDGESSIPASSSAAATDEACDAACIELGATSWLRETCEGVGADGSPILSSEGQGNAGSTTPTTTATAAATKADEFVVPNLNVQIPGFEKFSTPEKSADGSVVSVNFIAEYVNAVYGWIIAAGALVAVVMMMLGGLQYVMSRGKSKYIEKAKTRITNAITGLILLLAAYSIAFLIDPNTTNLKSIGVQYVPYIFISTEDTGSDVKALSLPDPAGGTNGIPYFNQRNYTQIYGAKCDGSPTIKTSGCGPTSAAMVLSHYGVSADPVSVAASFEAGGFRICGSGSSYAAFSDSAIVKDNSLKGENIPISNHEKIEGYLKNNEPIIISVGKSRFTNGGHFMVLTGIDSNGDFSINDPNSGYKSATKAEIYAAIKFAVYIHKK